MNSDERARAEVEKIATELEDLAERFSEASTGLRGQREDVQAAERGFEKLAALLRAIAGEQPECELPRRLADAPDVVADAQDAEAELA